MLLDESNGDRHCVLFEIMVNRRRKSTVYCLDNRSLTKRSMHDQFIRGTVTLALPKFFLDLNLQSPTVRRMTF